VYVLPLDPFDLFIWLRIEYECYDGLFGKKYDADRFVGVKLKIEIVPTYKSNSRVKHSDTIHSDDLDYFFHKHGKGIYDIIVLWSSDSVGQRILILA
jgi:hypothetical protein